MRATSIMAALLGALLLAAPAAAKHGPPASPGAAGLGDVLFPGLGNGGYDVRHYDLDVRYATAAPDQPLAGDVTISARATQSLSRFDLDFAGDGLEAVSVDGRPARWVRAGEELVVTPRRAIRAGRAFTVRVRGFTATPAVPSPDAPFSTAFFVTPDGSATAPQPDGAHRFLPCNDHPRDKASFSIRLDVPAGTQAIANGVLAGERTRAGRTVRRYVQRRPMATELLQLAVGRYQVDDRGRHRGIALRDVTAPGLTAELAPKLALSAEHLDYMEASVGRYPFDVYGSLVIDAELGFALETQTISLYDPTWFRGPEGLWNPTMVHELAHEWFGNSVSPWEWRDLWLNEGHATWYELLWAERFGWLEEDWGIPGDTLEDLMHNLYALQDQWRAQNGPPGAPLSGAPGDLFSLNVYLGSALALYALRQELGDRTFERVERTWLRRYADRSASTADFIALASRVARRDLSAFLGAWLYAPATPPMPGHPDWETEPVTPAAPVPLDLRTALVTRR